MINVIEPTVQAVILESSADLQSNGQIIGWNGGRLAWAIIQGKVSQLDDSPTKVHMVEYSLAKLPPNRIHKYVNAFWCRYFQSLIQVLGFIIESPVKATIQFDP
jgi:hypothetical protein